MHESRHEIHVASRDGLSEHDRPRRRGGGSRIELAILVFEDDVAGSGSVNGNLFEEQTVQGITAKADHVHGVDNTGDPTQDGQTDVDQEVSTTSALQEDTQRRQDDGEDDLADITL